MKNFKVSLTRSYVISINADNKESARELSEFFIGDCQDESTPADHNQCDFSINEIEMTINEAFDVEEITING